MLVLSPFIILIIVYGGYRITKGAFKPVREITETAYIIGKEKEFSRRISLNKNKDDIHQLAIVFNKMLDSLESSYEREKRFSSDVSHELRTPISAILFGSDYTLKYSRNLEESKESLGVIKRQSLRISIMVNQILDLASVEKLSKIEKAHLNFSRLITNLLIDYKKFIEERNIIVESYLEEDIEVNGNEILLLRVIDNLLSNAIKFTKDRIKIFLYRKDVKVVFKIQDNGEGISDKDLSKVWERFYKGDKSRTNNNDNSTGLGLSLVKAIVDKHEANIYIQKISESRVVFVVEFDEIN